MKMHKRRHRLPWMDDDREDSSNIPITEHAVPYAICSAPHQMNDVFPDDDASRCTVVCAARGHSYCCKMMVYLGLLQNNSFIEGK